MNYEYSEDLKYMMDALEKTHPSLYFNVSKNDLNEMIEKQMKEHPIKDIYDFFYLLRCVFGKMNDPHTMCYLDSTNRFPINLKFIDDKFYILTADEEYLNYRYKEITHINNVPIAEIVGELEKMIAYTASGWRTYEIENHLIISEVLLSLPSIDNNASTITYTLEKDGKMEYLTFEPNKKYNRDFVKGINYTTLLDEDNKIMTIRYTRCRENRPNQMQEFVESIQTISDEQGISNYIIDIRENPGGDDTVIKPLIQYLSNNANKLVTLIDYRVYSSGRFAVNDLKNIGSTFVGMDIGTDTNCFGEVIQFRLPNTHILLYCSSKYFYFDESMNQLVFVLGKENFDKFVSNEQNKKHFIKDVFQPDIYVENTLEDYAQGIDRQLEVAKDVISRETVKTM